jgi:PPOX class probable F420-dependent enzyme
VSLIPESHRSLAQDAGTAILSTFGHDGFPQSTAVGYLLDEDVFRFTVSSEKQKVKNLQRRPECTVFLVDPTTPFKTLEVRGRAELIDDHDFGWASRIAESRGSSVEQVRRITPAGAHRVCIAVHPVKVNAYG